MPKTRRARYRIRAFNSQRGLCYYCCFPMWLEDPKGFGAKWNLTSNDTLARRCTAEHLLAQQDGGTDAAKNIVAACLKCNQGRHRCATPLAAAPFGIFVQKQVHRGRWHRLRVLRAFGVA